MQPEITVTFDDKGQTTIVQNGLIFTMSIQQRLAFNRLIKGSIPMDHQLKIEYTLFPGGQVVEVD